MVRRLGHYDIVFDVLGSNDPTAVLETIGQKQSRVYRFTEGRLDPRNQRKKKDNNTQKLVCWDARGEPGSKVRADGASR